MGFGFGACGGDELLSADNQEQTHRIEATTHETSVNQEHDSNAQKTLISSETYSTPSLRSGCPAGKFCSWRDANYRGLRVEFSSCGCHNYGGPQGFNDKTSLPCNQALTILIHSPAKCQRSQKFVSSGGACSKS